MKIVKIWGGLGNQMFQFALYLKMKHIFNEEIKIDIDWFVDNQCHNGFELDKIFNIERILATPEECFYAGSKNRVYKNSNFLKKMYYKLFLHHKCYKKDNIYDVMGYLPEVFETGCEYIQGYWVSERYFSDIKDCLLDVYKFKGLDDKNKLLGNIMSNSNSVSIHVRRGDYLNPENSFITNVSETRYYDNAINYVRDRVDNPKWFVFSNDVEWCRKNLNLEDITFIDWNVGDNSYRDMQLMSLCKHNIIANSSFSFWGAYLNKDKDKIVVAPNKWCNINGCTVKDIYPYEWIITPID